MKYLIGIDDTDNKESRGTGFNSRQLAAGIQNNKLGKVTGITRHQLLVHPDIPYTSQNSSACLEVMADDYLSLKEYARDFMQNVGAIGSDVGLCITEYDKVTAEIITWGNNAKKIILKIDDAYTLAKKHDIYLEGLTGTKIGVIGALAATGLRAGGNDGRFIWLNATKNLRDIESGIHTLNYIINNAGVDKITPVDNEIKNYNDKINLNNWARPILKNGNAVLIVEKTNCKDYEWKCAAKDIIKELSN